MYLVQGTDYEAIYYALSSCPVLGPDCSLLHIYILYPHKTEAKLWLFMF
jgi:hypothetical protein